MVLNSCYGLNQHHHPHYVSFNVKDSDKITLESKEYLKKLQESLDKSKIVVSLQNNNQIK